MNDNMIRHCVDWIGQSSLVGWYASQKLNGCFGWWDGAETGEFFNRDGGIIKTPKWFKRDLPHGVFTGEIHAGLGAGMGNSNEGYKVVMTAVVQGGKWWNAVGPDKLPIRFTIFDAPNMVGTWPQRITYAWSCGSHFGGSVPFTRIESPKHLVEYMLRLKSINAEGACFSNPDEIGYHAGRTGSLLRWKF